MGKSLGTGYQRFKAPNFPYHGLAKVDGSNVTFLAIMGSEPGGKAFRVFLAELMANYDRISFVSMMNAQLEATLLGQGFKYDIQAPRDERPAYTWMKGDTPPQEAA